MDVIGSVMGPERVLPNSEDELGGEEERPGEGAPLPVWSGWEGGDGEEEEAGEVDGEEVEVEVEAEEEDEEEENNGGYYYQPLNQEPGEEPGEEGHAHSQQLQQVQQRIQVMGLHLPDAPPPDSDEEEDPEGAAAQRSQASIPMDADHVELVKRTMAAVALPSLGVPSWAREISEDQWKDMVQNTLQNRQSSAHLRIARRSNVPGP